jgi:hypothetical protein
VHETIAKDVTNEKLLIFGAEMGYFYLKIQKMQLFLRTKSISEITQKHWRNQIQPKIIYFHHYSHFNLYFIKYSFSQSNLNLLNISENIKDFIVI